MNRKRSRDLKRVFEQSVKSHVSGTLTSPVEKKGPHWRVPSPFGSTSASKGENKGPRAKGAHRCRRVVSGAWIDQA